MIIYFKKKNIFICSLCAVLFLVLTLYYAVADTNSDSAALSGKMVVIDAGHGEPDGGCVGADGTKEADINLAIALKLNEMLKSGGYGITMTREDKYALTGEDGSFVKKDDMYRRREIRDSSGADIFVSIHQNEYSDKSCHGAQVMYDSSDEESKLLAQYIQSELKASLDSENKRQIMAAPKSIFLLKNPAVTSVIVECGFLSNPGECAKLKTEEYQSDVARAVCTGIEKYFSGNN